MAERFSFTGPGQLGYPSYVDTETEVMLIAEPGGTYGMRSIEPAYPVPPSDGRWTAIKAAPPSPPPARPAVTVPAASEGAAA